MKEEMININANLLDEPSFTSFERWLFPCGRAASPVWREPPVRADRATIFEYFL